MFPVLMGLMAHQQTVAQLRARQSANREAITQMTAILPAVSVADRQLLLMSLLHREGALIELGILLADEDAKDAARAAQAATPTNGEGANSG